MADDEEVPEVEVTDTRTDKSVVVPSVTPIRRSGAKNVSDAHLQAAFIDEARHAMGQPSAEDAEECVGKLVRLTFNVDIPPVQGILTQIVDHPSSAPVYLVLDDDCDFLYPLNSVQSIKVVPSHVR